MTRFRQDFASAMGRIRLSLPALTWCNLGSNHQQRSSTHDVQHHSGSPGRQRGIERLTACGTLSRAIQRRIALVVARCDGVKRVLDRVAVLARPGVTVIRDELPRCIDPTEVVLGDLLVATAADQIVGDGTLISNRSADIDEALLTGESEVVPKQIGEGVFAGTFCAGGTIEYGVLPVTVGVLVRALTGGLPEEDARVLTFATLVVADLGLILANRTVARSVFAALSPPNTALGLVLGGAAGLLVAVVAVPSLRELFRFGVLHPDDVAVVIAASLVGLIWLEALRLVRLNVR